MKKYEKTITPTNLTYGEAISRVMFCGRCNEAKIIIGPKNTALYDLYNAVGMANIDNIWLCKVCQEARIELLSQNRF